MDFPSAAKQKFSQKKPSFVRIPLPCAISCIVKLDANDRRLSSTAFPFWKGWLKSIFFSNEKSRQQGGTRKKLVAPRRRRECACKRTAAASVTFCGKEAVSYTHLDVYKRQFRGGGRRIPAGGGKKTEDAAQDDAEDPYSRFVTRAHSGQVLSDLIFARPAPPDAAYWTKQKTGGASFKSPSRFAWFVIRWPPASVSYTHLDVYKRQQATHVNIPVTRMISIPEPSHHQNHNCQCLW